MSEIESLAGAEPLDQHLQRHRTDRIIMLSDGIFAIVTTLAALEIHLPTDAVSLAALLDESRQSLIAYVLSFLFTAVFWINNRELYARVARTDKILTTLTLATLCLIAIVPAAVHVIYIKGGLEVGFRFYAGVMMACGIANSASWIYWAARPGVARAGISAMERWGRATPTLFMPLLFAIMIISDFNNLLPVVLSASAVMIVLRRLVLPRLWSRKAVDSPA
ncbi:TMEM175 family protein [Sphingomonas sp. GlSt437]|uniref:TMEM175 family protein n=1 Tax=Sphingomonas sp. GlSt437 TaxID=3389970 RepID=UPI003A84366E